MIVGKLAVNICSMSGIDIVEVKKIEAEFNLSPWSIEDYYNEIERTDSISLVAKVDKKICVVSNYRRNNIGKSFIDKLAKTPQRNIKSIWLDVRKSNDSALSFYKKLNFKIICARKNFYRNPTEDGFVLKMEV